MSEQIGTNLKEAKANGYKKYHGKLCVQHGSTLRRVSDRSCVYCRALYANAYNKIVALRRHDVTDVPLYSKRLPAPTYVGNPCARGHDGTRYLSRGHCVACVQLARKKHASDPNKFELMRSKSAAWKKNNRMRQRRSKNRPPWMTADMDQAYYNEKNYRRDMGRPSEVDHFYPKNGHNFSGLDVPWNLIVIDKETNASKGNKHPRIFYGDDFDKMVKLVADTYEATLKEQTDAQYSIAA